MKTSDIALIAQKAGEILLKSGAEIYRVEETINSICNSYGVKGDCFALPTGIFMSVSDYSEETISLILRVKKREINFSKIEMVNELSRQLLKKALSLSEIMERLNKIEDVKLYPFTLRLFASGLAASVFCLMFGGTALEGFFSFVAGILIFLVAKGISKLTKFQFLEFFASGLVAGGVCLILSHIYIDINVYSIIIGSIMMQLPGVSITNAIRDALYGDTMSSLARFLESVLWVTALGAGVAVMLAFR